MVIGTILAFVVLIVLFVGLGRFFQRMQESSQERYDQNNRAGTLRTEPYRRPEGRRGRKGEQDRDRDRDLGPELDEY